MIKLLSLFIILFMLSAVSCPALEVVFKDAAEIDGDTIVVGDIAELSDQSELAQSLAGQIVGSSPEPGQVIELDSKSVISRLVRQSDALSSVFWRGAAAVSISRKSVTIGPLEVQSIIDSYIETNRHRLPQAAIRFIPDSMALPFALPSGTISWEVVPSSPGIIGSDRFSLIVKVDGRVRKNFSVFGRTEALAPVVVTTKTLKFGDLITPECVNLESRDLSESPNYTENPDLVIGAIAKRTIRSGSAVDTTAIEQPPLVKRGELVKMILSYKGMLLTASGVAKADGRKDEMIRVRNTSSNKLIYCRVQAPGLVEVSL